MHKHGISIPDEQLADFCRRWQIAELALFGSILRSDFTEKSDVDFLVTYAPDKIRLPWGEQPEVEELEQLLGRKVDWIPKNAVEHSRNPISRKSILQSAETIYAANE